MGSHARIEQRLIMPKEIIDLTLTRHFIWKISGDEVFGKTHKEVVKMVKACGNVIKLSVERGDHIVPSFEEISGKSKQSNGHEAPPRRRDTGGAYYAAAMQSHGLPGKI